MSAMNTTSIWGWPARILHWVMALLILGLTAVGLYAVEFQTDLIVRIDLTQTHKSFGFVAFVLAIIRVVWRFINPTPALPEGIPNWQKAASHASHWALYILILAIPLSGWLMSTASPLNDAGAYPVRIPNMVFGLFEMPDLFETGDKALSEMFAAAHFWLVMALLALLALHIAAALKHHFIDRDPILRRMTSGRN